MSKIVTIDFDIVMQPSIQFYNDLISEDDPYTDFVNKYPFISNFPADLYRYEYLTRYIVQCAKNKIPIRFIQKHDEIIKIAQEEWIDPMQLINIDHHHDIGYGSDFDFKARIKEPDCGNWVKYLKDGKYIDSYEWVKNENSDIDSDGLYYADKIINFPDCLLENLVVETGELIICASYEWIPPLYHPLFLTWQTIVEEINDR